MITFKKTNLNIITLFLFSQISYAQTVNLIKWNFPKSSELKTNNLVSEYSKFDFSEIWTFTKNSSIFGIIGKDHQRIKIKFTSVKKDSSNPNKYLVSGKSKVKGTICDFSGTIILTEIKEVKRMRFGVDNEHADKGIQSQGVLVAKYELNENPEQLHSGIFVGKLYSKWYLNSKNQIKYNNLEFMSDGFLNNAFVGTWKSYSTGKEKICNWGDYRIPITIKGFDIGAAEFSPSEKYYDKGWENYQKAWLYGDNIAKKEELNEWWK